MIQFQKHPTHLFGIHPLRIIFFIQELKKSQCSFKVDVMVSFHCLVLKGITYFTVILLSLVCLNRFHKHRVCKTDIKQDNLFI